MKYPANTLKLFFAAIFLLVGLNAAAAEKPAKPDGTIKISKFQVGFLIGIDAGSGTLEYKGKEYPFSIGGLKAGALAGVSSVELVGEVYNLKKPEDLAGTYAAASAGIALAGGVKGKTMKNQNGVVLDLRGTQAGVDLEIAAEGLVIKMKESGSTQ
jgi:hypothetical protein